MAYVVAFSACFFCRQPFQYNPHLVPSIRITGGQPDPNGTREPICASCHEQANRTRVAAGLAPWPAPHPDAYEPLPEELL